MSVRLARRLQRALGLDGVDAAEHDAEADLLGVDAAAAALRAAGAADGLAQDVLEGDS